MNKILPTNQGEGYQIRFHSIGGQGAYTAGQMIAALGSKIDELKSAVFADYGSEKKGSPVNVYVKFFEQNNPITNFAAVENPNLVVVLHEQLLKTVDVEKGMVENGVLLINTDLSPSELREMYQLNATKIATLNATKIGVEKNTKINTIMYGAAVNVIGFIEAEKAADEIEGKLSYKYPHLVKPNVDAFWEGYNQVNLAEFSSSQETHKANIETETLGYLNQNEGGIIYGGNTFLNNKSISREGLMPVFDKAKCINCVKCESTCPDDCFSWTEEEDRRGRMQMTLQGIDYQYCKGCLRCVEACPTEALKTQTETRGMADQISYKKIFDFVEGA